MEIKIESSVFTNEGTIPSKFTCDGENVSPPLTWGEPPAGTKSLALIVDDPDAPGGTFVHWVVYNIPSDTREFSENVKIKSISADTIEGTTHFSEEGYGGPCPPSGTHRYYFKIYALDTTVELKPGAGKNALLKAMEGHILAQGEIMGKYSRKR
jgi:hypothetical protein